MSSSPLAGYVRVSFVGGRSGDAFRSPDDQVAEISVWAKARGLQVEMLQAELDGKGDDAERPIFRAAIDGVKAGRYSGIVVAYLSRAGRDLRLMLDLWDEVEAAGGVAHSARENIDASTPSGRLQRNLLASIAQHELEERREGFARARAGAVAAGIWQRRQTPRGYDRDPVTRKLVPSDAAREVQQAFRYRAGGMPLVKIADMLKMTPHGARALLHNRVYLGELKVGQDVNPAAHEPLVEADIFDMAQAASPSRPARSAGWDGPALLAGLTRCASCGYVMARAQRKSVVYSCHGRHSGGRCPQPAAITAKRLEDYVELVVGHELEQGAFRPDAVEDERALQHARGAARAAADELAAFLQGVAAAGLAPKDFADGARQRREARDVARDELAEIERTLSGPVMPDLAEVWEHLEVRDKNFALRGLLEAVVVRPSGPGGRVVPVAERARVLGYGAGVFTQDGRRNGGRAIGVRAVVWPEADGPGVLRVPGLEQDGQAGGEAAAAD